QGRVTRTDANGHKWTRYGWIAEEICRGLRAGYVGDRRFNCRGLSARQIRQDIRRQCAETCGQQACPENCRRAAEARERKNPAADRGQYGIGNATAVRGRESTARHLPSARQGSRDRGARQDARLVCSRENQSQRRDKKGRDVECYITCGTSTPGRKSDLATTRVGSSRTFTIAVALHFRG